MRRPALHGRLPLSILALAAAAAGLLVSATSAHAATSGGPDWRDRVVANANGDAATLAVQDGERQRQLHEAARGRPEYELKEYRRELKCRDAAGEWIILTGGACADGQNIDGDRDCGEDTTVLPLWMRERATPAAAFGPWQLVDDGGCGADILPTLTAEDFRRLPIPSPVLNMQPAADWVLVNKETIVYTDPSPVTLTTDLLGYQVTVEATPTRFTYDFGDGRSLVTVDPGSPYPAFDTFHVYDALGTRSITLTTEWSGRYQVAGSPAWRDVDGTAQTTTTSAPFEVVERTSKLVAELCTAVPTPADCT